MQKRTEEGRVVESTLAVIGAAFCAAANVAPPAPSGADARKEHSMTTDTKIETRRRTLRCGPSVARVFGLVLLLGLTALAIAGAAQAYSVTVQIRGAGTVTGPGITCSSSIMTPSGSLGQSGDCTHDYGSFTPGTTLGAALVPGSSTFGWAFAGWAPCPNASSLNCSFGGLFNTTAYVVRANFNDGAAPSISLVSGPAAGSVVASTSASFTVATSDPTASFRCSVDSSPPVTSCGSTRLFTGLGQGSHTFRARSVDPSGNLSAIVERTWIVDTIAPAVPAIVAGPSGHVASTSATFVFAAGEPGAALECRLDLGAFVPCTSPRAYSGLAQGSHAFQVRARDAAGNVSGVASRSWIADTVAPSAPSVFQTGPASASGFTIGWSAATDAQGVTGYAVFLNGNPVGTVSGATLSHAFSGLACGQAHSPAIEAFDAAGNRSARTSASVSTAACPPAPKCVVPALKGKTLARAKTLLQQRKCKLGKVTRKFSKVRKGRIIKQSPAAGARRAVGAKVNVVVSRGRR